MWIVQEIIKAIKTRSNELAALFESRSGQIIVYVNLANKRQPVTIEIGRLKL